MVRQYFWLRRQPKGLLIKEFTNNEFENIYKIDDKYNNYGKMLDELGYGLMNLAIEQDSCNHEIQYFVGPDHIACNTCNRYPHKDKRAAHCVTKIFVKLV